MITDYFLSKNTANEIKLLNDNSVVEELLK